VIDLDELARAGIRDAHGRRGLLEYLDSLGFSAEELVEAEREGRLFALAGDVLMRSGRRVHSLRSAAEALGRPLADVEQAWAALGLTVTDADQIALTEADVDGLRTWSDLAATTGAASALGVLRVLGATMARFAEAESSAIRAGAPDIQLNHTHDELATARAYAGAAGFVPRVGRLIDAVHRQHLESARMYFETVLTDTSPTVLCGVGFVDLSGFTALTQLLTPGELSELLSVFSASVSDVVHADGGRVVKFIGDAVMWVSPTPDRLATAAADLVEHPKAREAGVQVRAGLAYGPVLALDGDYFGNAVNLAARLVASAEPEQILMTADLHEQLPEWPATPVAPLALRGFAEPVQAYALCRPVATTVEAGGGPCDEQVSPTGKYRHP
jgi:class 3 adenylate cyclase